MTSAFIDSSNKLLKILYLVFLLFPVVVFAQGPLSSGTIYKLKVNKTGVYKIDKSLLDELGVNSSNLNPDDIALFGFGLGILPQENAVTRPSELLEVPLKFIGNNSNAFQNNDYFIFYGQGADKISYDSINDFFNYELNLYDVSNYYFLRIKGGKRTKDIETENVALTNPNRISKLTQVYHHELEEVTALPDASGRYWFGEDFNTTTTKTIDVSVNNSASDLQLKTGVMAKSREESTFNINVNNISLGNILVPGAKDYNSNRYGRQGYMENDTFQKITVNPSSGLFNFTITYNKPLSDSEGYLDYLTLNVFTNLSKEKTNLIYYGVTNKVTDGVLLSSSLDYDFVWDITNPSKINGVDIISNQISILNQASYFSLVCFDTNDLLKPEYISSIQNQDVRGINTPELLIITADAYMEEANKLAAHRRSFSNLDVEVIEVSKVYNEFSSGRQDITAIRDFARYLYLKNNKLKYLLLFGQGSYDYKGIKREGSSQVPIYESRDVLHRTKTFSSDDYFGFFDDNEGFWGEDVDGKVDDTSSVDNDDLEIGIGRLPSRDKESAQVLLNKIISYDTASINTTNWKKNVLFVADDGDTNTHQKHANSLAVYVEENFTDFNSQRLFIDNQSKESTPSGAKSPETNRLLTDWIEKEGTLIVNYSGHGSTTNWAAEGILTSDMVTSFKNTAQLPLFFTATCEFGRYDNPAYISSAEKLLFNQLGGSTVLLTTTRPVYASSNLKINKAFYEAVFRKDNEGNYSHLGEIFRTTKNNSLSGVNNRNFSFLGDPSAKLKIPNKQIKITSINNVILSDSDTIRALDKVFLTGTIEENGNIDNTFNGEVFITLYEKPTISETLGNDGPETVFNYQERKFQLFRGVANVENGKFDFSFVVPKDIRYAYGSSKISFYANTPDNKEAIGSDVSIILGGSSKNPVIDDTPPEIDLSIYSDNNTSVVYPDTYVTATISDDSGINISGIGAGHDIRLILNDEDSSWIVNDYLVPISGVAKAYSLVFPLNDLPEGENTLTLEAWDVLNNRNEKSISFYVSPISEVEIKEFKAFPNPVENDLTIRFEHNLVGQDLEINSKIIAMNGNIVAVNDFTIENSESLIDLSYVGLRTNYNLINGVYVVQISINCPTLGIKTYQTTRIVLN